MSNKESQIITAFAGIVSAYGDKPAVCTNEKTLTYSQLSRYIDRLSRQIAAAYPQEEGTAVAKHPVALLFDHGLDSIASGLAALKAGKIYVPFDRTYPLKRLEYMLKHSGARLIMTNSQNLSTARQLAAAAAAKVEILDIDADRETDDWPGITTNPYAYLLYTSGSTGKPKAVLQAQENVLYFIRRYRETLTISRDDRMTLFSSFSHDAAIMDIYGALLNGATLYPVNIGKQDSLSSLVQWLNREQITIWHSVPTFFRYFMNELEAGPGVMFPHLRYIVLGGEAVRSSDIAKFRQLFPHTVLYNLYGQTESSYNGGAFTAPGDSMDKVVLGEPVKGTEFLVLDDDGGMVEELEVGELFVASPHIACGYWNDPGATANAFLYAAEIGRLYRTGDLARIDYDGSMEFMGRKDQQVKIRGYRVEPGEIESRLSLLPEIKATAVQAWPDPGGDIYICAYYVLHTPCAGNAFNVSRLRTFLAGELPDYMVPAYFMELEALPLTPNGKLDRRALPEPRKENSETQHIAPRDELEMKLAGIWARVLGCTAEKTGIDANFIELGGHSLKAVVLCAEIHKQLQVRLPLPQVFNTPTIRGLAEYIRAAARDVYCAIGPAEKKDFYPLSAAQKRLFILQRMDPQSTHYNMPVVAQLEGEVEVDKLQGAFDRLLRRHESLRTSVVIVADVPVQRVHDDVDFKIEYKNLATDTLPQHGQTRTFLKGAFLKEFIRAFDLSQAPLVRVGLLKLAGAKYILVVDIHHIAADGSSQVILARELMELLAGKDLPGLKLQYRDYAEWQNSEQEKELLKKQEVFWLDQLAGELHALHLPIDFPRPGVQSFEGDAVLFDLGREMTVALKALAVQQEVTLYMILLALLNVLLSKLGGQEDIITGSPAAGRNHADLQQVIGMLVNTVVLRNFVTGEKGFREFLREMKARATAVFENQDYPFEELVEKVVIERDISRNPIFDVMFVLQNMDTESETISGGTISLKLLDYRDNTTRFDLSVTAIEVAGNLHFTFAYATKLFKKKTIEQWCKYFKKIASEVLGDPGITLAGIEMMSPGEKERILFDFNKTGCDFPAAKTAHELFAEQAGRTGDRIAVSGKGQMTYRELDVQSNRLACLLTTKGIPANNIAAIQMERSVEMIIGIMGILKSGSAYLPIDPGYPQERIDYMLKDSNTKILLTAKDVFNFHHSSFELPRIHHSSHSSHLAYLIYTSGSTGRPKGVMIEHRGIANLMVFFEKALGICPDDRVLQFANSCFDASVWEIFMSLLHGAALHIVPTEIIAEPLLCEDFLGTRQITVATLPPVYLKHLHPAKITALRKLITAGSEADKDLVLTWRDKVAYINAYGPTEGTVCATWWPAPLNMDESQLSIPIGKPVNNTYIYIIDKNRQLQPVGVPGELCIGGAGVARGYLNNPELTAEKFIRFHHSNLYKTGDLARWLDDGNIEFLGRIDNQVKIRGFRVELGEIENRLKGRRDIKEAVVIARTGRDQSRGKELCAYIVSAAGYEAKFAAGLLRDDLARSLPAYMVPAYFVQIERMPLNSSGKIDRSALSGRPDPVVALSDNHTAPRDEIEKKLAELWAGVLGIEKIAVGIDHNFFHLGGHSLNTAVLADRIHKEMDVRVPLLEIFKNPCIRGMAEYIKNAVKERYLAIEPAEKKEYYALSSMQKRLYVLHRLDPGSTVYNVPLVVMLEGEPDRRRLQETFDRLLDRHEILRTSFRVAKGGPVQEIHNPGICRAPLQEINLETNLESNEQTHDINDFIRPFDLGRAPLLRIGLARLEQGKYLLILDMHHIITDGASMEILIREFLDLYGAGREQDRSHIQYKDFCEWQNRLFETPYLKHRAEFWLTEFSGEIPVLNLPLDYPRPAVRDFEGRSLHFEIDRKETGALKALALAEGATLYMVLLAVMDVLLAKLSGQEDIVIGVPVAGRRHADLEKMIGMFVNTLAIRNFPTAGKPFKIFLAEIKKKTIQAFENQEYPFENLVDKVGVHRDTSRSPLFDVMFTFQESETNPTRLPAGGIEKNGLQIKPFAYEKKTAKFDVNAAAVEIAGKLIFAFDYSAKLFKEETVARFIRYFKTIISTVLRGPDMQLYQVDILSEQEKRQLLVEFNNTAAEFPAGKGLHRLFAEQAARTPDHISLVGADPRVCPALSYRELDEQSDRMAYLLTEKGVQADNIVAISMPRSAEMVIGIMAILKAGGAYLPIDPGYPPERIEYMLKDSGAGILINKSEHLNFEFVCTRNFDIRASNLLSSNLAYIIYTSGSTGKPKGVMVEQRSAVNYIWWAAKCYVRGERVNFPLYTSISFDLTVTSLFTPLLTGNAIMIYGDNEAANELLIERIIDEDRVGVVKLTPSHLKMIKTKTPTRKAMNLKRFIVGGENLDRRLALDIHETFAGNVEIYNEYGPTEATVGCMIYRFDPAKDNGTSVPIGLPADNVRVYTLDKQHEPVPTGVTGQLYISGTGIARGYLNRPELTAEKFMPSATRGSFKKPPLDPTKFLFSYSPLYLTGDLAKRLDNGNIEFLGRMDNQVKIRGFRVELGEIEGRLTGHPDVKEAVILPGHDGNSPNANYLCAYIVPSTNGNANFRASHLREYLSGVLPHYMVPSHFVTLDRIPLTSSGKVNRHALENHKKSRLVSQTPYVAPRTAMEKLIAATWQEILQLEKTGVHDNFFDLGGNSFDIIKINNLLKEKLNRDFPVVKAFTYPTIRSLAEYLDNGETNSVPEAAAAAITEKMDKGKNRLRERSRRGRRI